MTTDTRKFLAGPLMPLAVLVAALLISLLFYAFTRPDRDGRIFFYPSNSGIRIGSERRGIPRRDTGAERIEVFLDELFLGPETLSLTYTMPRGTDARHVAIVDRTAYVDLNLRALDASGELPISLDEALANLRYNMLYNFPRIEDVVFTIEGSQVHAPYYAGEDPEE